MITDPVVVNRGAVPSAFGAGTATTMPRIRSDGYGAEYLAAAGDYGFKITHQRGKVFRSEVRLNFSQLYTDPLTGLQRWVDSSAYIVVRRPSAGFTNAQMKDILYGVMHFFGTSTNADKFLAFES